MTQRLRVSHRLRHQSIKVHKPSVLPRKMRYSTPVNSRAISGISTPGIIEGAHEGRGIGTRFLRHIERNSVLLFMVAADEPDVAKAYEVLLSELKEYNPELLVKDRVLAVTKTDLIDEKERKKIEKKLPADIPHVFISSVAQTGLNELKEELWKALNK